MKTIGIISCVLGVLAITGCATPQNQTGFVAQPHFVGAQVDFAALNRNNEDRTLRETYVDSWRNHPWYTAAAHIAVVGTGYYVGEKQGWWGSRGSSGNSNSTETRSQETTGEGWNVDMSGDGDGDRSFSITIQETPAANGNGFDNGGGFNGGSDNGF